MIQEEFFPETLVKGKDHPNGTCSECKFIQAIRFSHRTLFFCYAQGGGKYGKKITKNAIACKQKEPATDDTITVYDGYWGGKKGEVKR
ncbi:hypothetical protein [Effusibacillus consociatus]|uniref:Uncharacterized protein n=1 Tax=Effusibacillus consociatus TaxID=1117041 RepID=A0ABV9Q363_9BACL